MSERKALYYGEVEVIAGVICDGYILDDGTAVLSERGAANLLGMAHSSLQSMAVTGPSKSLKPFLQNNLSMAVTLVEVTAKTSPYQGRKIVVYSSEVIETIIRAYVMALGYDALQKNQVHIGRRCALLFCSLAKTALEAAIQEACGFAPEIQKSAQNHYASAMELIHEFGFQCSVDNHIATKKDIATFLQVPAGTLNSFLYKHSNEIKPVKLNAVAIQSIGSKATRMNGYHLDDVVKIVFGMDTEITVALKRRMFGDLGPFAKMDSKGEIRWREILAKIFAGFDLRFHHPIGKYRYYVDYFVPELLLCLECNGYDCHRSYDLQEEKEREQVIIQNYALIRFHHKTPLEELMNAILKTKPGNVIKLYGTEYTNQNFSTN